MLFEALKGDVRTTIRPWGVRCKYICLDPIDCDAIENILRTRRSNASIRRRSIGPDVVLNHHPPTLTRAKRAHRLSGVIRILPGDRASLGSTCPKSHQRILGEWLDR